MWILMTFGIQVLSIDGSKEEGSAILKQTLSACNHTTYCQLI